MRFGLLGPVEVRCQGRSITVGRGRERSVLAALLLDADRLVPTGRLIDQLWARPPTTAKAQLHNIISRLRQRLGTEELIVSRPGSYELRLGRHELDLLEFRRLVEQGRRAGGAGQPEEAVTAFCRALSLWRGPAMADVTEEFAADFRCALGEERLDTIEAWLSAKVMLGRPGDVARDIDPLLRDHPYRERLHEIKMIALAGAGRRADALNAYREAYDTLTDDLGVEPGRQLQSLAQRILSGENVLPPQTRERPAPRQLPPVTALLTGRDELIGEVCAALRRPAPTGPSVVLDGTCGAGKTTVALAAAYALGDSFPDGQLYADLRGTRSSPADPHEVLSRMLRALGADPALLPDDRDERIAMYRTHLAGRRILVLLDDAAGEAQVRPLLPGSAGCATLITSRWRLSALLGAARWTVPALSPESTVTLIGRLIGTERVAAARAAAGAIGELCGHLPLAVCVAAARLSLRPDWSLEEFRQRLSESRRRLDELTVGDLDVRGSIDLSYQALDAPASRLLRLLGLVPAPDWPRWVVRQLLLGDADAIIDRLAEAHLIEPLGRDVVGDSRFRLPGLNADFGRERALAEDDPATLAAARSVLLAC